MAGQTLHLQTQGWKLLPEGAMGRSGPGLGLEASETEPCKILPPPLRGNEGRALLPSDHSQVPHLLQPWPRLICKPCLSPGTRVCVCVCVSGEETCNKVCERV